MIGSFVTKLTAPTGRETFCDHCHRPIEQPISGRPRRFCPGKHGARCRQAYLRASKSPRAKPTGVPNADSDVLLLWRASCGGLLEIHHPDRGAGVCNMLSGSYGAQHGVPHVRVLFKSRSTRRAWEWMPSAELEILAWHGHIVQQEDGTHVTLKMPRHLRWVHPKARRDRNTKKKTVQVYDSDRNRDISTYAEKFNADGGKSAEVEVIIRQFAQSSMELAGAEDPDADRKKYRDGGKYYNDKLADLVFAAIDRRVTDGKCK